MATKSRVVGHSILFHPTTIEEAPWQQKVEYSGTFNTISPNYYNKKHHGNEM